MKNKITGKPYPYMSLWQFLNFELEGLNNAYSRQKEKAFYMQCHYEKHKNQNNRYKMNLNFSTCSEYKKKIQIVNQWIKEIEKIEQVKKENEQLKAQIEKLKEGKQYETCPYRSTDMGCDYCDYRDRDLKDEWEENDR